jgi:CBS domain containing-hemolysin-like protein
MGLGQQIVYLIILLAFSGFFSGSEVALISLSRFKVRHFFEKKSPGSVALKKLKDNPQRMLATILIGNNLVNVGSAALATSIAIGFSQNYGVGIATGIMTFLILVFGEITPKSIAQQHNEKIALLVSRPIWILSVISDPILRIFDLFLESFTKMFGSKKKAPLYSEEEFKSMLRYGEEEGTINEREKEMIHNVFEFDNINASEVMTPKTDMVIISKKNSIKQLVDFYLKKPLSRIPVYEKTREKIVGIVYTKDAFKYLHSKKPNVSIEKIMRKPLFIPETKKIDNLLRQFQKKQEHMAIVVNEHGSVIGLVTLEDVVEEIVGEIMDETDKVDPNIKRTNSKTWLVKGKTDIEEVNERLKMNIKEEGFDTLSGFIMHYSGKIPKENDEIIYGKFVLVIQELSGHRITKVKIVKK